MRLFLVVAREGRLASAGRKLGIDHTTVSRRLTGLETAIGTRLFDRSPRGVEPTAAGLEMVAHAERMEAEIDAVHTRLGQRDAGVSGAVRLSTPEAFGTFLVAPEAHRLYRQHPRLELELAPESRSVNLSQREADLAVVLTQPPRGRLATRRLVDYRIGLYASQAYLSDAPPLEQPEQVSGHPLVSYIEELIDLPELRTLDQFVGKARTAFRSSSSGAQQAAVAAGLGLGMLHCFAADRDARLVRLFPEKVEAVRSYWLVVHADQQRLPRVRAVINFLDALVEEQRARF